MQIMSRPIGELVTDRVVDALLPTTLRGAARLLDEESVGAILIADVRGTLGIFTERDLVRAVSEGEDVDQARVAEHLTDQLVTVDASASVLEVIQQMHRNGIRHVVVNGPEGHAGVVSMRAVLDAIIAEVAAPTPAP